MADRLVTIATFDVPERAHLAKGVLEAGGIPAAVTDEMTVSLFWHFSNAVGGIKVQVREEDAERAVALLEHELGPDGGVPAVDPEQLAAEAEAAAPEDRDRPEPDRPAPPPAVGTEESPPDAAVSDREGCARKLAFVAWVGLAFPPIAFYAVYLFLNAAFGEGKLSDRGRLNLLAGGLVTAGSLAWAYLFIEWLVAP